MNKGPIFRDPTKAVSDFNADIRNVARHTSLLVKNCESDEERINIILQAIKDGNDLYRCMLFLVGQLK